MWHNVLHPNINRSSWKKVEEKELTKLVHTHNAKNWESIAKQLGVSQDNGQIFLLGITYVIFLTNYLLRLSFNHKFSGLFLVAKCQH